MDEVSELNIESIKDSGMEEENHACWIVVAMNEERNEFRVVMLNKESKVIVWHDMGSREDMMKYALNILKSLK